MAVNRAQLRAASRAVVALVVALSATLALAPSAGAQAFATCEEAAAAGFSNMLAGEPGYSEALDPDGNGVACEEDFAGPPPEVLAATEAPAAPAAPADGQLAETGVSSWLLVLAAAAMFLAGRRFLSAGYERLDWFEGRPRSDVRYTVDSRRRSRR